MFASTYIPNFPAQAFIRNEPELAGKALAVVDGTPPLLKVVTTSPEAASAGVELGMAKLKVEHFFDIIVRQRSQTLETSAHAALLDCANAFSPRVEETSADTVVVDLDGLERLFGSYHAIAAQIYDQIILVGLQANVAVAANPDAAIHAARGFEGILVVPEGTQRSRLSTLPLQVLSADAEFVETLQRWGIWTFGAFADLPASKVSERLGQNGVRLHQLAQGRVARPLNPHHDSLRFVEAMELDHAIELLEPLTFVLSRLLEQICKRLRIRNRATHEIRVTLQLDERSAAPHERVLRLPLPVGDAKLLLKLLMLDLESYPPRTGVTKVQLEAIPTRPRTVQNGLFTPLAPEPEKLELTLARIAHLVGKENVGSPELLDTNRPDAFRMHEFDSLVTDSKRKSAHGSEPDEAAHPGLRFRQFRPVLEATVQLRDGIPVWTAFHGVFGPVITTSGPWNASGDWWREDQWSREEWDIGIESPSRNFGLYRIYRDTASNRWFAEGVYD